MKQTKYSAHVQLQYLLKKYNISTQQLHKEMTVYYNPTQWQITQTKYGKITGVEKKEQLVAAPVVKPQPTVIIKKRRTIQRP